MKKNLALALALATALALVLAVFFIQSSWDGSPVPGAYDGPVRYQVEVQSPAPAGSGPAPATVTGMFRRLKTP